MTFRMPDSWEQEQEWREEEWRQKQEEAKRVVDWPKPRKIKTNPVALPEPPSLQIEPAGSRGGDVGKIQWLVPEFIARGALVLLAAEKGSGKTTLIYRLAEAVQNGELFLDQIPTTKGQVLMIQGDEPPADSEYKFRLMGLEGLFDIAYHQDLLDLNELEVQIRTKKYDLIAIDSATSILTGNDLEVTDPEFTKNLYRIGKCLSENQVSCIVTTHLNKPIENRIRKTVTPHDISGLATISNACTDLWGLYKVPDIEWPDHFRLRCLGKRYCRADTLWDLEGDLEDFSWSLREVSDGSMPQDQLKIEQKVSNHFSQSPQPIKLEDIAKTVKSTYEVTRRICTQMFAQGMLSRSTKNTSGKGRPSYLYGPP